MRLIIIFLLIATGCVNGTVEKSVDDLTLLEIGQRLNGHWRLKEKRSCQSESSNDVSWTDTNETLHSYVDETKREVAVNNPACELDLP